MSPTCQPRAALPQRPVKKPMVVAVGLCLGLFAQACASAPSVTTASPAILAPPAHGDSPLIPVGQSPALGPQAAPVTAVVFSDFQCPFCVRHAATLYALQKAMPETVRLVFKHYPLDFHARAADAAQAAEAAHAQGKFWEMHDALFERSRELGQADFDGLMRQLAQRAGLDVVRFETDRQGQAAQQAVRQDLELVARLGVRGTPAVFINGRLVHGAQPLEKLRSVVQDEADKVRQALEKGSLTPNELYARRVEENLREEAAREKEREARQAAPEPTYVFVPVRPEEAVRTGQQAGHEGSQALVTIVMFANYQCPFSTRGTQTMQELLAGRDGRVRLVVRHLPLPMHAHARKASQLALAAHQQGQFWAMHDLLAQHYRELEGAERFGANLTLDQARFARDWQSPEVAALVETDLALAKEVGVRGTPTFVINGQVHVGALPLAQFQGLVDRELERGARIARQTGLSGEALYAAISQDAAREGGAPMAPPPVEALPEPAAPDLSALAPQNSPAHGPAQAPVVVYEFTSPQSPFWRQGAPALDALLKAYPGKIRVVYKSYALPFHPLSAPASRAMIAAHQQGKFWAMRALIAKEHDQLDARAAYMTFARTLKLNRARFARDFDAPATTEQLEQDRQMALKIGIEGVPTYVINGEVLVGQPTRESLEAAIQKALSAPRPPSPPSP